jgi:hypothetical protein
MCRQIRLELREGCSDRLEETYIDQPQNVCIPVPHFTKYCYDDHLKQGWGTRGLKATCGLLGP